MRFNNKNQFSLKLDEILQLHYFSPCKNKRWFVNSWNVTDLYLTSFKNFMLNYIQ